MESGIYQIRNLINGKVYIGQAQNFTVRKRKHFARLRVGTHTNPHLQNSFNKYGEENFVFEPLLRIEDNLDTTETNFIKITPVELRYNIALEGSAPMKNRKHSPESCTQMSKSAKGKFHSELHRARQSKAMMGKPKSIEHRANLSKSMMGIAPPNKGKFQEATKGEKNPKAILKDFQVIAIKALLQTNTLKQTEIAKMYAVTKHVISSIKRGATWKHII